MKNTLNKTFWLLCIAFILGVAIIEDTEKTSSWIRLCMAFFSIWFVTGCYIAEMRCREEDCDDGDDEHGNFPDIKNP